MAARSEASGWVLVLPSFSSPLPSPPPRGSNAKQDVFVFLWVPVFVFLLCLELSAGIPAVLRPVFAMCYLGLC